MRKQLLFAAFALLAALPSAAQTKFNEWGWPTPYEQVSPKSVQWLKDKGWWPVKVAYQAPWSGQNTVNIVMDRQGLLKARGIETKYQAFPSGPAINETIVSANFQVGNGGNFPFTSLLDKNVPVKAIAILSPNLLHALVVPPDSPLKSIKDLKGSNPPATIGLVTGSSAEFYFQMAMAMNGIQPGKDVILKNMPPGEQMALPKGISGVVAWDPTPAMMVEERKNGRVIDSIFPYNMYEGQFYVRTEMIENVPDVVQAFSDAFAEATLWIRLNPEKAAQLKSEDPMLKNFSKEILLQQVKAYSNLYKPTNIYPHAQFWGAVNESIFKWLYEQKRITRPLAAKDFSDAVDERFMKRTFEKLGWAVPKQPPFIPAGWKGDPGKPPFPEYIHAINTKEPQAFPEKGDLVKAWSFAGKSYNP
jgi:ABC-type nitrate/sulfonate/bicarbonate transport system substrate-binding protein